jgi:DNA-directed RNA polymerase specialized sigma24 family protein
MRTPAPSPLELTMQHESYERYRSALDRLAARDRKLVVARMEAQWSLSQIADSFKLATPDAARMAVNRALKRLSSEISGGAAST